MQHTNTKEILLKDKFTDMIDEKLALIFAEVISFNLKIPEGRHLVLTIGDGTEESNLMAIKTWVIEQFEDYDINNLEVNTALIAIEERLIDRITDLHTRNSLN